MQWAATGGREWALLVDLSLLWGRSFFPRSRWLTSGG